MNKKGMGTKELNIILLVINIILIISVIIVGIRLQKEEEEVRTLEAMEIKKAEQKITELNEINILGLRFKEEKKLDTYYIGDPIEYCVGIEDYSTILEEGIYNADIKIAVFVTEEGGIPQKLFTIWDGILETNKGPYEICNQIETQGMDPGVYELMVLVEDYIGDMKSTEIRSLNLIEKVDIIKGDIEFYHALFNSNNRNETRDSNEYKKGENIVLGVYFENTSPIQKSWLMLSMVVKDKNGAVLYSSDEYNIPDAEKYIPGYEYFEMSTQGIEKGQHTIELTMYDLYNDLEKIKTQEVIII